MRAKRAREAWLVVWWWVGMLLSLRSSIMFFASRERDGILLSPCSSSSSHPSVLPSPPPRAPVACVLQVIAIADGAQGRESLLVDVEVYSRVGEPVEAGGAVALPEGRVALAGYYLFPGV